MAFWDTIGSALGGLKEFGGNVLDGFDAVGAGKTLKDPTFGNYLGGFVNAAQPFAQKSQFDDMMSGLIGGGNMQAAQMYGQAEQYGQKLIDDKMERMYGRRKEADQKAAAQTYLDQYAPQIGPMGGALAAYGAIDPLGASQSMANYALQSMDPLRQAQIQKYQADAAQSQASIEAERRKRALFDQFLGGGSPGLQQLGQEIVTPFMPGGSVPGGQSEQASALQAMAGMVQPIDPSSLLIGDVPQQPAGQMMRTMPPPSPGMMQSAPTMPQMAPAAPQMDPQAPMPMAASQPPIMPQTAPRTSLGPGSDSFRQLGTALLASGDVQAGSALLQLADQMEKSGGPQTDLGKLIREEQRGLIPAGTAEAEAKRLRATADKAEREEAEQVKGKQDLEKALARISTNLDKLDEMRAIPSEERGVRSNIANYLSNAEGGEGWTGFIPGGQDIARMVGTKPQTLRDEIEADKGALSRAIKKATGMSSQEMNSNVELQRFLASLGASKSSYQARKKILQNLSEAYGTGDLSNQAKINFEDLPE